MKDMRENFNMEINKQMKYNKDKIINLEKNVKRIASERNIYEIELKELRLKYKDTLKENKEIKEKLETSISQIQDNKNYRLIIESLYSFYDDINNKIYLPTIIDNLNDYFDNSIANFRYIIQAMKNVCIKYNLNDIKNVLNVNEGFIQKNEDLSYHFRRFINMESKVLIKLEESKSCQQLYENKIEFLIDTAHKNNSIKDLKEKIEKSYENIKKLKKIIKLKE